MRGTVVCIVLSLAVVGVLGGTLYGEKESALQEVESKFEELKKFMFNTFKHVEEERRKTEQETEKQIDETLTMEKNKTLRTFAAEVTAVTKTAISRGKPLSVIDCIMKVALEGQEAVLKVDEDIKNELKNIKSRKERVLKMAEFQINLIGTAIRDLKVESIEKIKEAKNGFQALKADAIKKMDNAKKEFQELEARIPKPELKSEFLELKRQIEPKLQNVLLNNVRKLQKCL